MEKWKEKWEKGRISQCEKEFRDEFRMRDDDGRRFGRITDYLTMWGRKRCRLGRGLH